MVFASKGKCIFCEGNGSLSKEHIFPDWLRQYLPRTGNKTTHHVSFMGDITEGKLNRPGDLHSQRLRVVCERCNNGWMSRLQVLAKPILVPLILDQNWPDFGSDDQTILARWAAMFSMVNEYSDPKTATIPQFHRAILMNDNCMPPDWSVWVGRVDLNQSHPGAANHHGAIYHKFSKLYGSVSYHNFQSTGFCVGRCLMQTAMISPVDPDITIFPDRFSAGYDLRTVFPIGIDNLKKPNTLHDLDGFYKISNDGAVGLGLPVFTSKPIDKES